MRFKQFLTVFACFSALAFAEDEPKKAEPAKPKAPVTKNTDAEQTLAIKNAYIDLLFALNNKEATAKSLDQQVTERQKALQTLLDQTNAKLGCDPKGVRDTPDKKGYVCDTK
jgi:flagellar motility protein MotE (MotC chaperone)